jgi:hypothetical protein
MNATQCFMGTIAVTASIATFGCASQSDAFRQMSAADHERAASSSTDTALAQEHLDAASRLRNEERVACDGVPDADRLGGPFAQAQNVTHVDVVRDRVLLPKGFLEPVGVAVYLRAEPGMTQQWLGRIVACHVAHVAAMGGEDRPSPLSVANTQVAVSSTSVGFRITVTSKDSGIARSVIDKGEELAANARLPGSPAIGVAMSQ